MDYTSLDLKDLSFTRNNNYTYKGIKEKDVFDSATNKTYKSTLEFPRLAIKWKDNIEYGIVENIDVLRASSIETDGSDDTLWTLTILE